MRLSSVAREAARQANQLTDPQKAERPLGLIISQDSIWSSSQTAYGDPDWREKDKLERIGNDLLHQAGYQSHREAAIGVALTAGLWERDNGPVQSSRSTADWIMEHNGDPFGRETSERAKLRQADRKAKGQALSHCVHEYIQREWPDLPRLLKAKEGKPATLSEADLVEQAQARLRDKIPSTGSPRKSFEYVRDKRGRFTRSK